MSRKIDKSDGSLSPSTGHAEWQGLVASAAETRDHFGRWFKTLDTQVRERPGRAIAVAGGAGFVLGGGLLTGLTFKLVRVSLVVALRGTAVITALRLLSRAAQGEREALDVSSPV